MNIEVIPFDHRGTDKPESRKGSLVALHEVDRPFLFTRFGIEADEEVAHSTNVEVLAVVRGGGAYPTPVLSGEEGNAHGTGPLGFPFLFARSPVECPGNFVFPLSLDGKDQVIGNDGAGVTLGDFIAPGLLERLLGNACRPRATLFDHAVPSRSTPLGPRKVCGMSGKGDRL